MTERQRNNEQTSSNPDKSPETDPWPLRPSVYMTAAGMACSLPLLISGFSPTTIGLGFFLGAPLLVGGMGLYVWTVFLDLRERGIL